MSTTATKEHPSVFIQEEMDARGWDRDDLASAMMAADDDNWQVHRLAIDLYLEVGPRERHMVLGSGAAHYARAFGTSVDLWLNLERAWQQAYDEAQSARSTPPSEQPAQLLAAKEDAPPERHRCSGCGHRWEGLLPGAELCGECWRRAQAVILGPPVHRVTPPALRGEGIHQETCATHGDPLVCLACEADEHAHPAWRITSQQEGWRSLIAKWRARAEPNFADPEATEATLDYWRGVKRCAQDLETIMEQQQKERGEA
jgi:hypothetical protein